MTTYTVTETVVYTVPATSAEDAEARFCESEAPFDEFKGAVIERTATEDQEGV
jgi:hypothetical protein